MSKEPLMQASLACDQEIIDRARQMILENLIVAYGEEKGTEFFASMQPAPYADYQQLNDEQDVSHSHGRR